MINAIELSPHAEGTAYVAVTGYKLNDFAPYIYRTRNHGQRWERIDKGLPEGAFVRVVREDPVVPGLLYAGTEKGLFISWNDGGDWQSADLNLPAVPITDLRVRDDALAVATQGRAFWVLDDLFVLRQAAEADAAAPVHVYTPPALPWDGHRTAAAAPRAKIPRRTCRSTTTSRRTWRRTALSIEILDADGTVSAITAARRATTTAAALRAWIRAARLRSSTPRGGRPAALGLGPARRRPALPSTGTSLFEGYGGPAVAPGTYTVRVAAGTAVATTDVEVLPDPRVDADSAAIRSLGRHADAYRRRSCERSSSRWMAARSAREQVRACSRPTRTRPCSEWPMRRSTPSTPGNETSPSCATRPLRTRTPG
jgi:hypothetical protein